MCVPKSPALHLSIERSYFGPVDQCGRIIADSSSISQDVGEECWPDGVVMSEYRKRRSLELPGVDWRAFYVLCALGVIATGAMTVALLTFH
jgi:hypothetical protein